MTDKNNNEVYDCIIVGAGPAGMAAGIYAARYKLKVLIIAKEIGGTCLTAHQVENYPGFSQITGMGLMEKFKEHLLDYEVTLVTDEVRKIKKDEATDIIEVKTGKETYKGRTTILTLGTARRKLNIPGEKELLGKGVSYCATCDAMFFKDKVTGVIGGSDAAVTAALLLAEHAQKVYLIYRQDKLRSEPVWIERVEKNSKIEIIYNTNVLEVKGDKVVGSVKLDKVYNDSETLQLDGLFVEIGAVPAVSLAQNLGVKTNQNNMIVINSNCATNIAGVYAAGDITVGLCELQQVITAAAEGAIAATSVFKDLAKKK